MGETTRTKAELLAELDQLRAELGLLQADKRRHACLAAEHELTVRALRERVKELNCLYSITRLAQREGLSLAELLAEVGVLVCASWQYPESARARLRIAGAPEGGLSGGPYSGTDGAGAEYESPGYAQGRPRQHSPILLRGERIGEVEVVYLEDKPEADEGPFLREERHLIDAVADTLGRIVDARRAEAHLRTLSRELIKAQETERQRIASELHDHLAQDLATLKLGMDGILERQYPSPELVRSTLPELASGLASAIQDIRDLAYGLLPPGLEDLGLVSTLARYCQDIVARHGLAVEFYADGMDGLRLNFQTQINVYRIVQESLANIRKHAQASRVTVRLIHSHPSLIVRIEDDGRGVDLEQRLHEFYQLKKMGIWGMRERARLLGGRITFRSKPGKGMRILVELPAQGSGGQDE